MSFVSHHILQEIWVKWFTNTIIGEVAVEAIQMNVHSDISVQMALGHDTKVTQITYLTAPSQRAHRDDQNGHLDHPRMEKLCLRENHRRGPGRLVGLS